jgi:hypothetical protein
MTTMHQGALQGAVQGAVHGVRVPAETTLQRPPCTTLCHVSDRVHGASVQGDRGPSVQGVDDQVRGRNRNSTPCNGSQVGRPSTTRRSAYPMRSRVLKSHCSLNVSGVWNSKTCLGARACAGMVMAEASAMSESPVLRDWAGDVRRATGESVNPVWATTVSQTLRSPSGRGPGATRRQLRVRPGGCLLESMGIAGDAHSERRAGSGRRVLPPSHLPLVRPAYLSGISRERACSVGTSKVKVGMPAPGRRAGTRGSSGLTGGGGPVAARRGSAPPETRFCSRLRVGQILLGTTATSLPENDRGRTSHRSPETLRGNRQGHRNACLPADPPQRPAVRDADAHVGSRPTSVIDSPAQEPRIHA